MSYYRNEIPMKDPISFNVNIDRAKKDKLVKFIKGLEMSHSDFFNLLADGGLHAAPFMREKRKSFIKQRIQELSDTENALRIEAEELQNEYS